MVMVPLTYEPNTQIAPATATQPTGDDKSTPSSSLLSSSSEDCSAIKVAATNAKFSTLGRNVGMSMGVGTDGGIAAHRCNACRSPEGTLFERLDHGVGSGRNS